MKTSMYKIIIIAITLATILVHLFVSCVDIYSPDCETGNCVVVKIKGSVVVKPTGTGMSDIPVEVNFVNFNTYPSHGMIIFSGKTDKNGEFNFNATIDLNSFKDYSLRVIVPAQENYIHNPHSDSGYSAITFHSFDEDAFQNINFEFYKETVLTINLNRTQTDDFELFYMQQFILKNYIHHPIYVNGANASSRSLQQKAVADIYTIIVWQKILKNGERHSHIDSLICRTNTNNVFNINF